MVKIFFFRKEQPLNRGFLCSKTMQAVQHQTLPNLRQKTRTPYTAILSPFYPPHLPLTPHSEWLQNMQTDTASLDSTICAPASDASPQSQTNSVSTAHFLFIRVNLKVSKLHMTYLFALFPFILSGETKRRILLPA